MDKFRIVLLGSFATLFGLNTAWAEDEIEPVVVTAEKRVEDVQKTAIAVTVATGELFSTEGIEDASLLSETTPNLVIGHVGTGTQPFLRGVGQALTASNVNPKVTINVDGIYTKSSVTGVDLFDIERVEVLPGPQGTLWGRNAAGGAINIITNAPSNNYESAVTTEFGNYSLVHVTGFVNAPIVDGLDVRAAYNVDRHDGYLTNGSNDDDTVSARLSALYKPSDNLSVLVRAEYFHVGGTGNALPIVGASVLPTFVVDPSNPWYATFPTANLKNENWGEYVNAEINYHLGDLTLTYIPYVAKNSSSLVTFLGSSNFDVIESGTSYSQELRLAGDTNISHWVIGLYQWGGISDGYIDILAAPPNKIVDITRGHSYAAFGQYTYSVFDRFRVTAGGRYSWDYFNGFASSPGPGNVNNAALSNNDFNWKLGAEFDLTPKSMAYASVQTGYTEGGFSATPIAPGATPILAPEHITAFTVGIKNRLWNDRLQINDEAYYYNYRNYQLVSKLIQPYSIYYNIPKSEIYGDQLDVTVLATPEDEITLGVGALSAKIKEFSVTGLNFSGYQLPQAPSLTAIAAFQHTWKIGSGATLVGRSETNYSSGYWSTFNHAPEVTHQSAYTQTNLNLTYEPSGGRWSVGLWARNVGNTAFYQGFGAINAFSASGGINPPRTFGARFSARF